MKTLTVMLTLMLAALSFNLKAWNHVSFGVDVIIEHKFSPTELNVTILTGEIKIGNTVTLQKHVDYLRAMKDKYTITGNTGNEATIQAFYKNEKISLDDAFSLMNNYNNYDVVISSTDNEVPNDFYYALEVLTSDKQSLLDYIKQCPELETQISQKDENIFTIGKIKSRTKALEVQNKLNRAGLKNCVVVAYEGNKQVPVYIIGR